MGSPLEWYNLVFYIALVVGMLFALGSALGGPGKDKDGHGHDHSHGHSHGHGHGHGHGHLAKHVGGEAHELDGHPSWLSDVLGVGRVPFSILLMLLFLLFGGVGVMANAVLSRLLASALLFFPLSALLALTASFFLTGRVARLIHRVAPISESYNVTKRDLVSRTGKVVATAEGDFAVAAVKDHEGNVQQISCRTGGAGLAVGQEILVLEYDPDKDQYLIEPFSSELESA